MPPVHLPLVMAAMAEMFRGGTVPAEIHVSRDTYADMIAAIMAANIEQPKGKRVLPSARAKKLSGWRLNGVPIIQNDKIPIGGLVMRPLHLINDRNWMSKLKFEPQTPQVPVPQSAPSPEGTENVTSGSFKRPGGQTPTDTLIAAMERVERAHKAVVILFTEPNHVEVVAALSQFELVSLLHGTLTRVVQGD